MNIVIKSALFLFVLSQQLCAVQFIFKNTLFSEQIRGGLFLVNAVPLSTPALSYNGSATLLTSDHVISEITVAVHLPDGRQFTYAANPSPLLIPSSDKSVVTLRVDSLDPLLKNLYCTYFNEVGQKRAVTFIFV